MGISIWQLLIILAIVLVLFGAKKIRSLGSDLGASIKNFRAAVKEGGEDSEDDEQGNEPQRLEGHESGRVIDGDAATEQSTPEGGGASGREKA